MNNSSLALSALSTLSALSASSAVSVSSASSAVFASSASSEVSVASSTLSLVSSNGWNSEVDLYENFLEREEFYDNRIEDKYELVEDMQKDEVYDWVELQ